MQGRTRSIRAGHSVTSAGTPLHYKYPTSKIFWLNAMILRARSYEDDEAESKKVWLDDASFFLSFQKEEENAVPYGRSEPLTPSKAAKVTTQKQSRQLQ